MADIKDTTPCDERKDMPNGLWINNRFYPFSQETIAAALASDIVATMRVQRPEPRAE